MSTATSQFIRIFGTCVLIVTWVSSPTIAEEPVAATDPESRIAEAASPEAAELFAKAGELQNAGELEEATEVWGEFIKQYGDDPLRTEADHYLGICLLQQQNYGAAAKQFVSVLGESENDQLKEEALVSLAWCHYSLGVSENLKEDQLQKAADYFRRHTDEYPQSHTVDESHFFVGECLSLLQQFEEAEAAYRAVIDNHPKSKHLPSALVSAAYVNRSHGRYREAVLDHERLAREFPDQASQPDVKLNFADTLVAMHRVARAEKLFAELAQKNDLPTQEYVLFRQATCLERLERFAEAGDVYSNLIQRFPTSGAVGSAGLAAGRSYLLAGRGDAAERALTEALTHDGAHQAGARHWMCQTLLAGGQTTKALQWAKETLATPELAFIERLRAQLDLAEASAAAQGEPSAVFAKFDALLAEEMGADTSQAPPGGDHADQEMARADHLDRKALIIRTAIRTAIAARATDQINKYGQQLISHLGDHPQAPVVERLIVDNYLRAGDFARAAERLAGMVQRYPNHSESELWSLQLAAAHYRVGDFAAAVDAAKTLAEREPPLALVDPSEVWCIWGSASLQLGDTAEAVAALEHSLAETPGPVIRQVILFQLAEAHQRLANRDAAVEALQELLDAEVIAQAPESQQTFPLACAEIAGIQADRETADRMYKTLCNEAIAPETLAQSTPSEQAGQPQQSAQPQLPVEPEFMAEPAQSAGNQQTVALQRAWLAVREEDYDAAEVDFTRLIESSSLSTPESAEALYGRATVLKKLNHAAKAIEDLRTYFDQPDRGFDEDALLLMAECQLVEQQWEAAHTTLRRLMEEFPQSPNMDQALSRMTVALVRTGRRPLATKAVERLESEFPESQWLARASRYLGDGQFEAGQFGEAAETYLKVMRSTRVLAEMETASYRRGWALFQNKAYEEAARVFDNQRRQFPEGALANRAEFMLAESLFKSGEFDQARNHYEQMVSRQSLDSELTAIALLHGSECYRRGDEHQRAVIWLRRIATDYPKSVYVPKSIYELGRAYLKLGDEDRAIAQFVTATNSGKTEIAGRSHYKLGEIYARQREFARALREFHTLTHGFKDRDRAQLARLALWRARAGIEAARCAEQLAKQARSPRERQAYRQQVAESLRFVIESFPQTKEATVAQRALQRLRVAQDPLQRSR